MDIDLNIFIPVLTASLSFIGSAWIWRLNSRENRLQELYKRKEDKYSKLIESIKGFNENTKESKLVEEFLLQLNYCWLYCRDEVIKKGYSFLESVHANSKESFDDEKRDKILGELMLVIRKDLLSNKKRDSTSLTSSTYKNYRAV